MPVPVPWHDVLYLMYLCNYNYIFFNMLSLSPPPALPPAHHQCAVPVHRLPPRTAGHDTQQVSGVIPPPLLFPPHATRTLTRGQQTAPFPSIFMHRSAWKQGEGGQGVAPSSAVPTLHGLANPHMLANTHPFQASVAVA